MSEEVKKEWPAPTAAEVGVAKVTMLIYNKLTSGIGIPTEHFYGKSIVEPTKMYQYLNTRLRVDRVGNDDDVLMELGHPTGPRIGHFEVTMDGKVFDIIVAAKV